jgi:outer membrane receptor for ferrienterochelin and colicin
MKRILFLLLALLCAAPLAASTPERPEPNANEGENTDSAAVAAAIETAAMSEDLIYSVDRVPERTFDTARDVEVITHEEIRRANVRELGQLLERRLGIGVIRGESGTMPMIRGLGGKQIMFLVDGVKVNNATWRSGSKEYLSFFDVSQIERIEIVRGVVSVLGTESLGGVVNIITRKHAHDIDAPVSGTIGGRYASGERSFGSTLTASLSAGSLRLDAGLSSTRAGDVKGGGGVGSQDGTGFEQTSGHLNGQWFLTREKALTLNYQQGRSLGETPPNNISLLAGKFDPSRLSLLSLSYQDLTSRSWEDSIRVTAFWNDQEEIREVLLVTPATGARRTQREWDKDEMTGLNVELGSFIGSHHLVYGVDFTDEKLGSAKRATALSTGVVTNLRGNEMDGATYRTTSIYLQDRADFGRWLTVIGGARLAQFEASGHEESSLGVVEIDVKRANVTGALNLIGHLTPRLNVIGNVISGYRAPNLDELSGSATKPGIFWIPNPEANPEKVLSFEAGFKYDGSRLRGSAFYFRNRFTDYLVFTPTTFRGLSFNDTNGNGRRDPGEFPVMHLANVGKATIRGAEGKIELDLARHVSVTANYSRLIGTDDVAGGPLTLMPPATGSIGFRYLSASRRLPWAEIDFRVAQAQTRLSPTDVANFYIGPNGAPAYQVVDIRGGFTLMNRLALSLAVENVLDEQYRFIASNRYEAGRQLVVGTQFQF